jgi:hypothetical protein
VCVLSLGGGGGAFVDRLYEVENRTETCVSLRRRRFACNQNVDFSARKKRLMSVIKSAEILNVRNLHKKPDYHVALKVFSI